MAQASLIAMINGHAIGGGWGLTLAWLAGKLSRPLTEVKARINAIARTAMPEVNAVTERERCSTPAGSGSSAGDSVRLSRPEDSLTSRHR